MRAVNRRVLPTFAVLLGIAFASTIVPADAQAIAGLERTDETTDEDYNPTKFAAARCSDNDKHVIGGGAEIRDGGEDIARLTSLAPYLPPQSGGHEYFRVSARAIFNGQYVPWALTAYAICADEDDLEGFKRVSETFDNAGSSTFAQATARCPGGTVAYGAGGTIQEEPLATHKGRIGLQMIRTSGALDITRVTARENTPLDTPNPWKLTAWAFCAEPQEGIHVEGLGDLDGDQRATSFCNDPTTYVHGAGGGASGPGVTDAGRSWLKTIVPSFTLRSMTATMAGPEPPTGGVIASHTCAGGR